MPRRTDISSILIIGAAACAACAERPAETQNQASADLVRIARSIADRCGLSGQIEFAASAERDLVITRLDPNAEYGKVDCVLRGLRPDNPNIGFVGNEAYNWQANNAQAH